ncbi:MAG: Ig-like domain-containing protein [Clostridium sp.]|nr:Ig-like domain-containing protein [Clostridium sp.]MCM1208559.1 Ig-like domain-containing protein [Ruminococcus sp.]
MKNKHWLKTSILLLMAIMLSLCCIRYPVIALAEQNSDVPFEEKNGCEEFECIEISAEEAYLFSEKFDVQEQALYVAGRNWSIYGNDYCRERLTAEEKEFYDDIDSVCRKYINTDVDAEYNESFQNYYIESVSYNGLEYERAKDIAFLYAYQNPQYYFLSSGLIYNPTRKIIWLRCYDAFADGEARKRVTEAFFDKIDAWTMEISAEANDYDKEKKAYDIVCQNVVYKAGEYDQSAYSAVMQGESVCAGYTKMFGIIMNASGIDTVGITGSGHAWNKVHLYGKWYNVDSTWDDLGNISGNNYFNKSDANIRTGHVPFSIYDGLAPLAYEDYTVKPEKIVPVTGVAIDKSACNLIMGNNETLNLTVQVSPADATDKTTWWQSSDTNVASVNQDGVVTAVGPGETNIMVITTDGLYVAICRINVYAVYDIPQAPTEKSKSDTSITLNEIAGCLYSLDGINWQSSTTFNNLKPNTAYNFYAKRAGAGFYMESDKSSGTSIWTKAVDSEVTSSGLYVAEHNNRHILVGMVTTTTNPADLEYRWLAYRTDTEEWSEIRDWVANDEWLDWTPDLSGQYILLGQARVIGNEDSIAEADIGIEHHKQIKGKCQMPYIGEGGGYLIGVESFDNPNQAYQYEMLILDCTLLAQNKPAWIYTTGKTKVNEGNALWTIWQPKYGYYWTLFRIYDENGTMIDEECYGFVNAY